ncbi:hypothetical protein KCV05_g202, partial [Aureobasidium melanogenum]
MCFPRCRQRPIDLEDLVFAKACLSCARSEDTRGSWLRARADGCENRKPPTVSAAVHTDRARVGKPQDRVADILRRKTPPTRPLSAVAYPLFSPLHARLKAANMRPSLAWRFQLLFGPCFSPQSSHASCCFPPPSPLHRSSAIVVLNQPSQLGQFCIIFALDKSKAAPVIIILPFYPSKSIIREVASSAPPKHSSQEDLTSRSRQVSSNH